jgi:hypothetical protein
MVIFYFVVFAIILIVFLNSIRASELPIILDSGGQFFDEIQFSTQEFYTGIEEGIVRREFENISYKRIDLYGGGILSSKREYLRITRNDLTFDVCAAPFGTGFFVSWRLGEKTSWFDHFPILKNFKGTKTYFQKDTEGMYISGIKAIIKEAINNVDQEPKGMRALADVK